MQLYISENLHKSDNNLKKALNCEIFHDSVLSKGRQNVVVCKKYEKSQLQLIEDVTTITLIECCGDVVFDVRLMGVVYKYWGYNSYVFDSDYQVIATGLFDSVLVQRSSCGKNYRINCGVVSYGHQFRDMNVNIVANVVFNILRMLDPWIIRPFKGHDHELAVTMLIIARRMRTIIPKHVMNYILNMAVVSVRFS